MHVIDRIKRSIQSQEYRRGIKKTVIDTYGGKCKCCGLDDYYEFLCIDHIGGKKQDGAPRGGWLFYSWLKKNGFPSGYRVLCHNCNMAIGFYGYCPHE